MRHYDGRASLAIALALGLIGCKTETEQPGVESVPLDRGAASPAMVGSPLLSPPPPITPTRDSIKRDADGRLRLGGVSWVLPEGWELQPPSGPMRVGEFGVPGGGTMAIFRFGRGGGTVASNLERWRSQFIERDTIWTENDLSAGFPIHLTWIEGTFQDAMSAHGESHPPQKKMGQALIGVLIEAPEGLIVFKSVLPIASSRSLLPAVRRLLAGIGSTPKGV